VRKGHAGRKVNSQEGARIHISKDLPSLPRVSSWLRGNARSFSKRSVPWG